MAQYSDKSRLVTLLLLIFLGGFGAHRFYAGKFGTAVLFIITFGGLGIWWLIDLVMVCVGSFTDIHGRPIFKWTEDGSV
ncbi:MAG: TM2 domain-containing protein [Planctomycetota bacterium]|nr:TM2 domain-containing protein [Planctomycetota bacterium]